jgi:hypothetical protein
MKKRRTKRALEVSKRCHCPDRKACSHHWFLRVFAAGKRRRLDLTAMFPGEPVEVAAAKAKDHARKGLTVETRLTLGNVVDRYVAARGSRPHHYLKGLRAVEVAVANGATIKLEHKPTT